jgi:hypothetical protein
MSGLLRIMSRAISGIKGCEGGTSENWFVWLYLRSWADVRQATTCAELKSRERYMFALSVLCKIGHRYLGPFELPTSR